MASGEQLTPRVVGQPIETAPRDGRQLLLWIRPCVQAMGGVWIIASWHLEAKAWHTPYFAAPTLWSPLPEVPR